MCHPSLRHYHTLDSSSSAKQTEGIVSSSSGHPAPGASAWHVGGSSVPISASNLYIFKAAIPVRRHNDVVPPQTTEGRNSPCSSMCRKVWSSTAREHGRHCRRILSTLFQALYHAMIAQTLLRDPQLTPRSTARRIGNTRHWSPIVV